MGECKAGKKHYFLNSSWNISRQKMSWYFTSLVARNNV